MDTVSPARRSEIMGRVKGKDTRPELLIRRLVHGMGYRYRLHRRDLPGQPDLVFPGRKKVIFVHGCFWHRHANCEAAKLPASNRSYWEQKQAGNARRDRRNARELRRKGWDVLVVWECRVRASAQEKIKKRLKRFLDDQDGG